MKYWPTILLKAYIIIKGGRVDDPYPGLMPRHYRLLLLGAARRLAASKIPTDTT